jgi:uncharacterized protein GlcG (DUF336 family)
MSEISAAEAQSAIDVAIKKGREIGVPISIAVVDSGRNLIAFMRMDDALLGTIEAAQHKAYTARTVNMRTADLGPLVQPGGPLYAFERSHRTPFVVFGGGIPVRRNGKVIGAVGLSGGSPEQDDVVAEAVVAHLEAR